MEKSKKTIHESLMMIQEKLKAPKDKYNTFGKYKYRSCESILNAVKPLLKETGTVLLMKDNLVQMGDRIYIVATATLSNGEEQVETSALAREDEKLAGMTGGQITGAASSYARKYALNALFAIDDSVADLDDVNKEPDGKPSLEQQAIEEINAVKTLEELKSIYNKYIAMDSSLGSKNSPFFVATSERSKALKGI